MLQQGYRGQGRFRLRDALVRATPLGQMRDGFAYSASKITELDVAQIAYYASSIFWRASLSASHDREHGISLGRRCEEEFRAYLTGSADFPAGAALIVQVANTNSPLNVFSFPFSQNHAAGYHQHSFLAQGVLFWLFVGGRLLPKLDLICIVRSREQIIFYRTRLKSASIQDPSICWQKHWGNDRVRDFYSVVPEMAGRSFGIPGQRDLFQEISPER